MAQLDGRKMFEEAMKFANENGRMLVDLEGKLAYCIEVEICRRNLRTC